MGVEESFRTTIWGLVAGAKDDPGQLREVVTAYYPALRTYLARAFRVSDGRVDDWLHDFLIHTGWLGAVVRRAEPGRGRFRALLATAARNFVLDRLRRESPGGSLPAGYDPPGGAGAADPQFDATWAESVVTQVIEAFHRGCAADPARADVWNVFKARYLEPTPWAGATIADTFDLTKGQVDAAARAARAEFRRLALDLLGRQTTGPEEQDEAFADLFEVVRGYDRLGRWRQTDLPYLRRAAGDSMPSILLPVPGADEADLRVGELFTHAMAERLLEQFEAEWRAAAPRSPGLRELLASAEPDLGELNRVKAFAKQRRVGGGDGHEARVRHEAATWLYHAALAVAWHRRRARISSIPDAALARGLAWAAARGWGWAELDPLLEAMAAELRSA